MTQQTNPQSSEELPRFGDYVVIEEKRYGVDNEHFVYKVIDILKSNTWRTVPVDGRHQESEMHDHSEWIVKVICDLPSNERVERFRVADVKIQHRFINQEVQKALSMVEEPGIISFPFPMTTDEYKKMCEVIKWYKASINKIKEQYKAKGSL